MLANIVAFGVRLSVLMAVAFHAAGQRPPITAEEAADRMRPGEPGRMPDKFRLLEPGQIPLTAEGAVVIDAFTGETLYEKNADLPLYPASTTKMLTALLIIEAGDLDKEVLVTAEDARVGESSLSLRAGDRYTRRQMLFGLMLKSANDVAHSLARDNAGTMPAFALKMTQRARELGATHSNFMNPHGLHHPQHVTTARDLVIIARHAMQQPLFRQIVSTQRFAWHRYYVPPDPNAPLAATPAPSKSKSARPAKPSPPPGPEVWALTNYNRLLTRFEGCTGIKTGFTNPARHTLVSSAQRNGREVIAAVMKSGKLEKWEDSMLLLTHGLENPPN